MWKILDFILVDFEEGCFNLLILFHLSKRHVLVICSKILLNIITKITPGCKVCSQIVYGAKCSRIVYGAKYNLVHNLG